MTATKHKRRTLRFYIEFKGGWRWHLRGHNGRVLASSGAAYTKRWQAVTAARFYYASIHACTSCPEIVLGPSPPKAATLFDLVKPTEYRDGGDYRDA